MAEGLNGHCVCANGADPRELLRVLCRRHHLRSLLASDRDLHYGWVVKAVYLDSLFTCRFQCRSRLMTIDGEDGLEMPFELPPKADRKPKPMEWSGAARVRGQCF
eukprot:s3850_g3.t1